MSNFYWIGGRLWLDAVNSEFIQGGVRVDGWSSSAALETWARGASEHHEEAGALSGFSGADDELLARMKNLRAALRRACETFRAGADCTGADSLVSPKEALSEAVNAINAGLQSRSVTLQLEAGESGWRERESASGEATDALWLLARSAARSWSQGELARLRPCGNPDCILWFLDTSKNGTRRWCSMQGCGNRHKVAAHLERRKQNGN